MPLPPKLTSLITLSLTLLSLSSLITPTSAGALSDRVTAGKLVSIIAAEGQSPSSNIINTGTTNNTNIGNNINIGLGTTNNIHSTINVNTPNKHTRFKACGTPYSTFEAKVMREALHDVKIQKEKFGRRYYNTMGNVKRQAPSVTFDLNFNVVAGNMTMQGGWVPDSMIKAQVDFLNKSYAASGIQFKHTTTTRILSNNWANELFLPDSDEREELILNFGELFKKGDMRTLNVNTLFLTAIPSSIDDIPPEGSLIFGFALPPSISSQFPLVDGVYIRHDSLPGGPFEKAQGGTLVHEAGHWLSLWHTFQGGCAGGNAEGESDEVADTPAQLDATEGCPVGRDSCPGLVGLDPITNFMDYSDESCQEEFTRGQVERMWDAIDAYRS